MKLKCIEEKKKDPRYFLLKFVLKILTNNGKRGVSRKNKEYREFINNLPQSRRRNSIPYMIKNLLLREYTFDTYFWIYDKMVIEHGYDGPKIVRFKKNPRMVTTPLYLTDEFIENNKKIVNGEQ